MSLVSSDQSVVGVPATIIVPSSSNSATFTVTTNPVSVSTSVSISASYAGSTQSAILTVIPPNNNWLNLAWNERNTINISNPGGSTLNNYQFHVTLDSSFDFTKAKSDGSDLRFTSDDGVTLIPFWIESWNPTAMNASIWVKVPTIPAAGATIYLYYGNSAAASASNGVATFEFFDDFDASAAGTTTLGYFRLGSPETIMVQDQPWENYAPHTLSVVQVNSGGYAYWGYYGLQDSCGGVGLAFSNDLSNWTKYTGNPVFENGRWPSVLKVGDIFYMIYTKDYCHDSYLELAVSSDGINFSDVKTIVQPQSGMRNQNPHLYFNPNEGKYYIYWYNGRPPYYIRARSAATIEGLDDTSSETIVMQSNTDILAAPNMFYKDGTYFLSTESMDSNGWNTKIYSSTSPTSGFALLPGNPVLADGSACFFQHVFGNYLHGFYCKQDQSGTWTLEHRSADLTAGRLSFNSQTSLDTSKWITTNDSWAITTDTQQDGTVGGVAKGTLGARQALLSTYQGGDYILEAYGRLLGGRVWGLGVRATDQNDLYSTNLYEDLDTSNNLYEYSWVNGIPTTLSSKAVGRIDPNTWYKLSVKVHSNSIDVYKDNLLMLQTSASQNVFGAVALYGEQYTTAEYNNVLVRKYAAVEPTINNGTTTILSVSSVSLLPNSVVSGDTSQGIVVLSGPAPSDGAVVSLASSDQTVAGVPATITVPSGSTSATFTVTTNPVSVTTSVTISVSYNGTTQSAALTLMPKIWPDLTAWSERNTINITNPGGSALSNFQVHVTLDSSFDFSKAKGDGGDLRFTSDDGVTLIQFWVESWDPVSKSASLWVKVPSIPATGATLYLYYGNPAAGSTSNGAATFEFFDDFDSGVGSTVDAGKWTATGGTWSVVSDTQQDGIVGGVAKGTFGLARQVLLSKYQGGDYVLEAYGKLLGGRVWGLGVRATDQNNLYSTNLYEDLDTMKNLYEYNWVNGRATTLSNTAVGRIDSNAWYKLSVKVHSNSIDVYKDNVLTLQTSASQYVSGAVALYGEQNTMAEYNNVLVRKYAAIEPSAAVQSSLLPSVVSLTVVPTSVVGGSTSQGTVVLSSPAPSGGTVVALANSNQLVTGVPATVTVPTGGTSTTFIVTTNPVSVTTAVTISASFNGTIQTATLTVTPSVVSSLSLAPTNVVGGSTSQGTVVLNGPAPSGGTVVTLASVDQMVAGVPATIIVPNGGTSATFTVTTNPVSVTTAVTISASFNGTIQTAIITITPPGVSLLSLTPTSVVGGSASQGTVVLSGPAPNGGAVVSLASSALTVAGVPATITVPSGSTSATFTVTTNPVSATTSVAISAGYNGATQTTILTVMPVNWFDLTWKARNTINIANPGGSALSNFQVHITLDSSFDFTKVKSDGSDLRFTSDDGVTLIPFWVESWNPVSKSASLWVKATSVPATGATLYLYYGNPAAGSASNGAATFEFFDDFESGVGSTVDAGKWTATGGTWSVVSDTQQDGTVGRVAKGTFGLARQVLLSKYQGGDYVLEAYGKLLGGRVWGLGVRATDQNNLYSTNLYEDLDTTKNLYEYNWVNGRTTTLGSMAAGKIDMRTWYKLSVKAHSNSIDVYKDNVLMLQTSASQYVSGAVALYGEQNTIAEYNNVLVRKYTAIEPSATVQ